ncbi:MAG: hypothetical protein IJZ50_00220 [Alistipes sp.]|nr:hypothetical protein [Alistipes sp.]
MKKLFKTILAVAVVAVGAMFVSCNNDPDVPVVSVEIADVEVDGLGGTINIPFVLKGAVDIIPKVKTDALWLHGFTATDSIVQCQVDGNPTLDVRTATLTFEFDDKLTVDVLVTQSVADSDFVINVSYVSAYGCWVNIAPIKHEGPFLFLIVSKNYFELVGDMENLYKEDLDYIRELAEYAGCTIEEYLPMAANMYSALGEEVNMSYSKLTPETQYVVYCYGMDAQGNRTSDICYKEFTTTIVATSDIEFSLDVSDIEAHSAKIVVTPSNDDLYYWTYISEMDYAQYDDYAVMENMINNVKAQVDRGADITDIIHSGASSQTPSSLWSGTKYHIIAWGMDERCTATTKPTNIGSFTTLSDGISDDCTFEISCPEVGQTDILINVKPSNNATRYMICPVEENICGSYNDEQMAQRLINMEQARFDDAFYGVGVDWSNVEWIFTGEQTKWGRADLDWTFEAGKTYRIFVFGVDANGSRTTNVARFDQKAADVEPSDMTFEVELLENSWNHPVFRITPSANDEYWLACVMKTEYVDWYRDSDGSILDHEMMHMLEEEYFDGQAKYYAKQGESESSFYWSSDSKYSLLVCGWSGSNTTPFFEYKFSTPSIPWEESDADVEVRYSLFDGAELAKMDPMVWAGYEDNCIIYIEYTPNESAAHWYGGVWLPISSYELGVDHLIPLLKDDTVSHVDRLWGRYIGLEFDSTYSLSWFAEDAEGRFGKWNYIEFTPNRHEGESNMSEPYDFWTNPAPYSQTLVM